ncbi:MAG: PAS domain-containing protein [Candidatus Hydrogenedentes bacterium]|nr:PAS domain-containing protein [Candidatus Hydrogenedentota bacterium]
MTEETKKPGRQDEAGTAPGGSASEQIVRGLTSGVIAVDAAGRITAVNPSACAHLNIDPDILCTGRLFDAIDGLAPFAAILSAVREQRQSVSRQEVLVGEGAAHAKEIGVSVSILEGPEAYNGAVFLFTDMTERRKLERAASANAQLASLGELAAGVVHELRNPLAIISGRAELVLRKLGVEDPFRESIETILDESAQLSKSITLFLGFSKPFVLNPEACTAASIAERAFELCRARAAEKEVSLSLHILDDVDEMDVDRMRCAEAIANILSNAIDAVDRSGRIEVSVCQEGSDTVFEVSDDGPGIHLDAGEDIFSPFFTKRRDGTGLGLAMVDRIVRAQGGSVAYVNRERGGTRFTLRIPTVHARITG